MRLSLLALLVVLFFTACEHKARTAATAQPPMSAMLLKASLDSRTLIDHPDAIGLSGSCDTLNATWYVSERGEKLLRMDQKGHVESYTISGVPEHVDLEGLACKDSLFYISTESDIPDRDHDLVLVVTLSDNAAQVRDTLTVHYPSGILAGANQGLEGLCIAGDWLIAVGEVQSESAGSRKAPVLRQRLGDNNTYTHWANLTTRTGKLSGLDCRIERGKIQLFAIERHYEVSRIVHYELGPEDSEAQSIIDLAHIIRDGDNFESVLVSDDGQIQLSNDNQYKTITGPSEVTVFLPERSLAL